MASNLDGGSGATPVWVWLGKIRRPQGRKGEVLTTILTDFPEKFSERKKLWLLTGAGSAQESAREVELRHHWLHKGDVVLHFVGVDSISDAEKLAGMTVAIAREERAALGEDVYYAGDLMGCQLVDVAGVNAAGVDVAGVDAASVDAASVDAAAYPGRVVGVIEDVDREAGPVALLVVRAAAGGEELLIPWAKAYLRKVDLDAKRVEMALPEGLLDLNP